MTRSTHHPGYQRFLSLLREARREVGITQVELAARIRNRQVFVSKLERGERRMDVVDFIEYCEAAGIDAVALFEALKTALDQGPRSRGGKLAIHGKRRTTQRIPKR